MSFYPSVSLSVHLFSLPYFVFSLFLLPEELLALPDLQAGRGPSCRRFSTPVSPDYSAFEERPALSIPEVVITDHDEVSNIIHDISPLRGQLSAYQRLSLQIMTRLAIYNIL